MKDAAAHVAGAMASTGQYWQERPVKPPPYIPTAEQVHELYAELLAKVVARAPDPRTGRVYDHAMARGLRVIRLTKIEEAEQRFVLQTTVGGGGFNNVMIVDAEGNPAEWVPAPKPQPVTKTELQAVVDAQNAQIAEMQSQIEALRPKGES